MHRLVRLIVAIGLLHATLFSALPIGAQGGDDGLGVTLDLAATVLAPSELDVPERGERFGISATAPISRDAFFIREFGEENVGASIEDDFLETGWLGTHLHQYSVLASTDQSDIITGYQFDVSQFADEKGAEAAFELLDADDERLDANIDIGDDSYLIESSTPAGGSITEDIPTLKLVFLVGDVVASTRILNIATGTLADPEEIKPLADALLERIEAVQDGDAPELSRLAQPVEFDKQITMTANYLRLDGVTIQRVVETEEEALALTGGEAEHVYFHQQRGPSPFGVDDSILHHIVYLFAFEDEDEAAAFLDGAEDFLAGTPRVEAVDVIPGDRRIGDDSIALSLSGVTTANRPFQAVAIFVQVGAFVARVQMNTTDEAEAPPIAAVEVMAEAQASCLEQGECADPIAVSDLPVVGDESGETQADEPDGEVGTYESPQYGFTLEYGPEWEVSAEDTDQGDEYDQVTLEHDLGFVGIIGDPDYAADEMVDCVADYQAGLEQTEGVDQVRELRRESGEEDDRAWAAFSYELAVDDDGEPLEVVRYIECRSLDGATVVVLQTSLDADYDDLSAAREELLAGLVA